MREYKLPLTQKPVPKELKDTGKYEYVVQEEVSRHIAQRIERRTMRTLESCDARVHSALQSVFDMSRDYLSTPIGIKDTFSNHDERRAFRHSLTGDSKAFVEHQRIRAGAALTIFAYIESLPYFVGTHAPLFSDIAEQAKIFQDKNRSRYESETYDTLPFEEKTRLAHSTTKELLALLLSLGVLVRANKSALQAVK